MVDQPRAPVIQNSYPRSYAACVIASTSSRFLGFDTMYGGPGQVPTREFPNPRGYPFSITLRTWVNSTFVRKDTFFGLAGKPNYDWPNPMLPKPPLNRGTASRNETLLLPPGPGAGGVPHGLQFFATMGKLKSF